MILAGARRGVQPPRALARLTGSPPLETDTPRQERLNRLLSDEEHAKAAGDADALAFTEHRIDRLLDEARASAAESEQPHPGFDGGVQRRPGPRSAGPTANDFIREAMIQSNVEHAAVPRELRASNLKL
jgi:hypothetical protein